MRRKRNKNYQARVRHMQSTPTPVLVTSKTIQSPTESAQTTPAWRVSNATHRYPTGTFQSNPSLIHVPFPRSFVENEATYGYSKAPDLRKTIQIVSGLNAVLSVIVSVFGYFVIAKTLEEEDGDEQLLNGMKSSICFVSIIQVILVVVYWRTSLQYLDYVRHVYRLSPIPVRRLFQSRQYMTLCALECSFNLLFLPPEVMVSGEIYQFGTESVLTLNDVLFLLLLLRNYHSLKFLFWCSSFSGVNTYFFTSFFNVEPGLVFLLRSYLSKYTFKLVLGLGSAVTLMFGLTLFVFEKGTDFPVFEQSWNGFWITASTLPTIGYGDIAPITFLGQFTMVLVCFIGSGMFAVITAISEKKMNLNLTECTMYSELLYARSKRRYADLATLLIQKWWRLMLKRQQHVRNVHTIIGFYRQLRVYRGVIIACQRVKDRRFERQIHAFGVSTTKQIRAMTEYFQPILRAEELVKCIYRPGTSFGLSTS